MSSKCLARSFAVMDSFFASGSDEISLRLLKSGLVVGVVLRLKPLRSRSAVLLRVEALESEPAAD